MYNHKRGFALRLGDQIAEDCVELLLSEHRSHSGNAENLVFVRVVPCGGHGGDDGVFVCVLSVGAPLDQLVAGPLFSANSRL